MNVLNWRANKGNENCLYWHTNLIHSYVHFENSKYLMQIVTPFYIRHLLFVLSQNAHVNALN